MFRKCVFHPLIMLLKWLLLHLHIPFFYFEIQTLMRGSFFHQLKPGEGSTSGGHLTARYSSLSCRQVKAKEMSECVCVHVWVCLTHSLGVDGMHSKDECCDESQKTIFKNTAFTCVHEQAGYSTVQKQVGDVEIERSHAMQQDVQPERHTEKDRTIYHRGKFSQHFQCDVICTSREKIK